MSAYARLSMNSLFGRVPAKWFRIGMRFVPPLRNTGVRVTSISADWRRWTLTLPLSIRTRNYVGTHFGGTLYSAMDPHYMIAWMHILGPDYVVWDKAATIRFLRPGRGTLHGELCIGQDEVDGIRAACRESGDGKHDHTFLWQWLDRDDEVVCEVEKVIHFREVRP